MDDRSVPIGAAAALYDLAPSTLRWWERQGVLGPAEREGGRRRYDEVGLRRIGLAYLCAVTGTMPLDRVAVVTAGDQDREEWHDAVREQVVRIDEQLARLTAARAYLEHLLGCPDDDVARDFTELDDELRRHTSRGRHADAELVAAARSAAATTRPAERLTTRRRTPQT